MRGGVVYLRAHRARRTRIKKSLETSDWEVAGARRDALEALKCVGRPPFSTAEVPRFAEFAKRYLAEDTSPLRRRPAATGAPT